MRSATAVTRIVGGALLGLLVSAIPAQAQLAVGEWTRTDPGGKGMTMTVTPCCNGGYRLTYHVPIAPGQPPLVMTVDSPMDGTEVPTTVGGKPTAQTMAVKRIDAHHYAGVVKQNGQPYLTAKSTLSADGKTLTVEDSMADATKVTEIWVKK